MNVSHNEPANLIEGAAEAAMSAAEMYVASLGGKVETIYVAILASDWPEKIDTVAAAGGKGLPSEETMRARAVLTFLLSEAAQTAKVLGLQITLVPMTKKQGHG